MTLGAPPPGESNNPDGGPGALQEWDCPKCGESFKQLALHMRHCDGGDGS